MPLRADPAARFDCIAPAGFRLLAALEDASLYLGCDLVITAGTNGTHSGPADPHYLGCAYDVRSHDIADKDGVLLEVMGVLEDGTPTPDSGGYVTQHFFGWLESPGLPDEHFHFQKRHGVQYP